jgi:hypothetical protein
MPLRWAIYEPIIEGQLVRGSAPIPRPSELVREEQRACSACKIDASGESAKPQRAWYRPGSRHNAWESMVRRRRIGLPLVNALSLYVSLSFASPTGWTANKRHLPLMMVFPMDSPHHNFWQVVKCEALVWD